MSRITTNQLNRNILTQINAAQIRVSDAQQKLASGRDLNRPEDDPARVGKAVLLASDLETLELHRRAIGEGQSWTNIADSALEKTSGVVQRIRELTVQAQNDTYSPAQRQAIATEINGLAESIKEQANTKYNGMYVFSGTVNSTPPYAAGGVDTYSGNSGQIVREIAPNVTMQLNQPGSSLFGDNTSGLLRTIRDIAGALSVGTAAAMNSIRTTHMAALDVAHDTLNAGRAVLGEKQSRLDIADERSLEIKEAQIELLSKTQNVDYTEEVVKFSQHRAAYDAALKAGANIIQKSLVDFLG